jgi:TctA family transporter
MVAALSLIGRAPGISIAVQSRDFLYACVLGAVLGMVFNVFR